MARALESVTPAGTPPSLLPVPETKTPFLLASAIVGLFMQLKLITGPPNDTGGGAV